MTTATNIQMATLNEANSDFKEAGNMTNENNIHGPRSLVSNFIRNNGAILAGLLIGGMIAAASMLPGNASADTPARPFSDIEAAAVTANVIDMDLLDPGFYETKLARTSSTANVIDMDLLDPGFYDAKLVSTSSVWESPGFDPYEDLAAKVIRTSSTANVIDMDLLDPGFYDAKVIRSGNTANVIDMDLLDLLDPGFYDAKVVRTSPSWEGLQEDNII